MEKIISAAENYIRELFSENADGHGNDQPQGLLKQMDGDCLMDNEFKGNENENWRREDFGR